MSWASCIRCSVVTIALLATVGLFLSYRFDMDVSVVVNFVQQYSINRPSSLQTAVTPTPEKKILTNSNADIVDQTSTNNRINTTGFVSSKILTNLESKDQANFVKHLNATLNTSAGTTPKKAPRPPAATPALTPTTSRPIPVSNTNKSQIVEPVCKFPQLLVDDPLIKPYLKHYDPMECSKEANWIYTRDGYFYIDSEAVKRHGEITCKYWRYDRTSEDYFNEKALGTFVNGTPISGDAFYAQCKAADGQAYDNVHAAVPQPDEEFLDKLKFYQDKSGSKTKGLNMNVLIYLMDSVSRINFVRKLPKFYKYLTESMDAYVMEGFNIVGDGTPWAVIPMLTGHFQTELPEARRRFDNASFVDKWPFLFKNFTRSGYVTSYAEEQPWFSAFTYKLKGFDRQPVDHYLRTMLIAVEKYKKDHKPYCLGDTPRSMVWLRFWRELQDVYRPFGIRQFSMMFSSETSHDDYNYVQSLDDHWVREFEYLKDNNYLNDTIVVIMGDHGRRFGAVRQTQTGKLEEKLPFLAVVTPPWFRKNHPRSDENLKKNRNRLVSVFDLHETFSNVLNFPRDGAMGNLSRRGISLFDEIPPERTCADAQIKAHFCSCLDWEEVRNLTDRIVLSAANTVIKYFNDQLVEVPRKCANLTLGKMINARLLKPNDRLMAFKESLDFDNYSPNFSADSKLESVLYQIRFTTEPGGGDWEASLTYFFKPDTFGMSFDDISRLNEYNEQAQCVINTHQHLRTFCFCK